VKEKDVEGRKDKEIGNRKTNLKWVAEERERERERKGFVERERKRERMGKKGKKEYLRRKE
jgi:hypothetical protein